MYSNCSVNSKNTDKVILNTYKLPENVDFSSSMIMPGFDIKTSKNNKKP